MTAISQIVPNLLGGVSQQPDPIKLPGQVKEAKNTLLDPTFGCRKRPPTSFVATLANDVPAGAKWFNIFRDNSERYVVAIYKPADTNTVIRVWEADTGVERTVTIDPSAITYLNAEDSRNISELTINDYTLLTNSEAIVTMSSDSDSDDAEPEALVVVNQVAYNTNYNVDFLKDGEQSQQEKVYRATKISVDPGSFEVQDEGGCSFASSESFSVDGAGDQEGLGFTLTTSCQPTQTTTEIPGQVYPTGVQDEINNGVTSGAYQFGQQGFCTYQFGPADQYPLGSYVYHTFTGSTPAGNLTVRVEFRTVKVNNGSYISDKPKYVFSNASVTSYDSNGSSSWAAGQQITEVVSFSGDTNRYLTVDDGPMPTFPGGSTAGIRVSVSSTTTSTPTTDYDFKSVYRSRVVLNNGGVNWRQGDTVNVTMVGKSYTITVEEEAFGYSYVSESSVSFTTAKDTAEGVLDVGGIVGELTTEINALENYSATPVGNVIHIVRTDGRDFNIQTRGGTTNNALYGIKNSVNDISKLPSQCVAGVVLLVRNSAESDADDYYVKFKPASGDIPGQGAWEETHKIGIETSLNPSTMPHALIREADGSFTCRPLSATFDDALFWASREVGDEDTNPEPSFVNKNIRDMFFYMNRLGILSSDSVVLSQPGDYFNFFVGSAIAVSDADPIDMTASSTRPATLKAALGTPKGLLLFAENNQFLLSTSEAAFGPSTVKLSEISSYSYSSSVRPLETGVSVLFSTEADTFSKVYEMAVDSIENRPIVAENTRIVPEFIPPNLTTSASSPNNSIVFYGNDTETLWVFKFFNSEDKRSMAGWSQWVYPSPVNLIGFDHDTGYIVQHNGTDHILVKFQMLDDPKTSPITAFGQKFAPRLDNYLTKEQVVIEDIEDQEDMKNIRFPQGSFTDTATASIILTIEGSSTLFRSPEVLQDDNGYYIQVDNAVAEQDFIVGIDYDMSVHLPSFFVKEEQRADRRNIPIVENLYIDLYYSGRYTATLKRLGYLDRDIDLDVTDANIYFANEPAIEEVTSREIPVYCRGDYASVIVTASDPLPASITSYRWEGHYNNRGISIV